MKKTEILVVLDRSGSMASMKLEAEGGFARFIQEQRAIPGDVRVTLAQFDDIYQVVYEARPLADVPPLTLEPRGWTALLDAMGRTIELQGKRIHDEKWAELVVVVFITDGGENASREYTRTRVKEMVQHAEKNGWQVIFLGANMDAIAVGGSIGTRSVNTATYSNTGAGMTAALASASASTQSYRAGNAPVDLSQLVANNGGKAAP